MASKTTYELALEIGGKIQSSFQSSIGSVNQKLNSIGKTAKTAAKIATAAFAAVKVGNFVKGAVSTYADFDQAMANTAATAGASSEEYEKLEAAALEMGKKTTKTATEASEALGYMALAGWDVDTSVSALEPVLRLSEATSMDLATCSDLVTDSMSALGLTVDELSGYLDVACKANNKSNQTAEQLMEAYISCGGVMNNLGVSVEDSATALGVLANRGIKGSEAGNKLNTVLINLTSGTGRAGKMMEKLGISAFDSEGKFIGLQETLQRVNEATKNLTEEERNAALTAIGGKTQIDTLNDLLAGLNTTTEDGRTEWQALNDELYNAQGAMMDMAEKVTDTLPGAMATFGSAIDDIKIRLCKIFVPMAKDAIFAIADYIPNITDKVIECTKTLLEKAVPAILSFRDKAVVFFGRVRPVLENIKNKGVETFLFLAKTGKTAFENIKEKIIENKPVIDKVIAVLLDLKSKLSEAFEKAKPIIAYIATVAIPAVVDAIMKVIGAAATVYQKLDEWGALKPIIIGIAGAIAMIKMVKFANSVFNAVKAVKALVAVFLAQKKAMLVNIVAKVKDLALTAAIRALYIKDAIAKGASTAATWAQTAAMTALNAVMSVNPIILVVGAIVALVAIFVIAYKKSEKFRALVNKAFESIKNAASVALTAITKFFRSAWESIKSLFAGFGQFFQSLWNKVVTIFSTVGSFFGNVFSSAWNTIKSVFVGFGQFFQSLWDGVVTIFSAVGSFFGNVFSSAWSAITGVFGNVVSFFGGVWDNIISIFGTIGVAISDAISGAVKGAINTVLGGAVKIINGFISAINTAIGVINKIPGVSIDKLDKLEVPALAEGGVVTKPTLALVGEGKDNEAVVPLNKLWSKMQSVVSNVVKIPQQGNGSFDMFNKIKQLVSGSQTSDGKSEGGSVTKELYNTVNNNTTTNKSNEVNTSRDLQKIIFSPQIIIQGNASKNDVQSALDMSQAKFNQMMAEYTRQKGRISFV